MFDSSFIFYAISCLIGAILFVNIEMTGVIPILNLISGAVYLVLHGIATTWIISLIYLGIGAAVSVVFGGITLLIGLKIGTSGRGGRSLTIFSTIHG
jgi:hypothetical protein